MARICCSADVLDAYGISEDISYHYCFLVKGYDEGYYFGLTANTEDDYGSIVLGIHYHLPYHCFDKVLKY